MTDNISHLPVGGPLKGVRGAMLTFRDDPAMAPVSLCHDYYADGLAVIQDGRILAAGEYADVTPAYPGLTDIDRYEDALILPGFIDCHAHYVQAPMIGSYGDTLIDWLNRYTFPTEARFRDKDFADEVARMFIREPQPPMSSPQPSKPRSMPCLRNRNATTPAPSPGRCCKTATCPKT